MAKMAKIAKTNKTVSTGRAKALKAASVLKNKAIQKEQAFTVRKLSESDIDKAIRSIQTRGQSLRKLAQETLISIVLHYQACGDYTKIKIFHDTINANMSKSMGRCMIAWLSEFTSIAFEAKGDEKGFYHDKAKATANKSVHGYVNSDGFAVPFWKFEKDVDELPTALDAEAILKIIDKAVQRLVNLEIEKSYGVKTEQGDKIVYNRIPHEIQSSLVQDALTFAKNAGLNMYETEAKLVKAAELVQ